MFHVSKPNRKRSRHINAGSNGQATGLSASHRLGCLFMLQPQYSYHTHGRAGSRETAAQRHGRCLVAEQTLSSDGHSPRLTSAVYRPPQWDPGPLFPSRPCHIEQLANSSSLSPTEARTLSRTTSSASCTARPSYELMHYITTARTRAQASGKLCSRNRAIVI